MSHLLRPTKWRIVSSSGGGATIGEGIAAGGTHLSLYISTNANDNADSPGVIELGYTGVGAGPSGGLIPIKFSYNFSMSQMPSTGLIYQPPLSHGKDPEPQDLAGPCVVGVGSGSFGFGGSVTLIFFRVADPTCFSHPICIAIGVLGGTGVGLPGGPSASAIGYVGYLRVSNVNPETLTYTESPEPPNLRQPDFRVVPLALPADVLFDFDRAVLKPGAEPLLRSTAQFLAKQRAKSVIIEGHTDSKGTDQYNVQLSIARANAVRNWLVTNQVPNANSFVARGVGKAQPIAANTKPDGSDNPEGRRQNRRVTFVLIP
jgi:outer membrane protein OmpA-like peptidoglycan-associated protein